MWSSTFDPESILSHYSRQIESKVRLKFILIQTVELNWVKHRTSHVLNHLILFSTCEVRRLTRAPENFCWNHNIHLNSLKTMWFPHQSPDLLAKKAWPVPKAKTSFLGLLNTSKNEEYVSYTFFNSFALCLAKRDWWVLSVSFLFSVTSNLSLVLCPELSFTEKSSLQHTRSEKAK